MRRLRENEPSPETVCASCETRSEENRNGCEIVTDTVLRMSCGNRGEACADCGGETSQIVPEYTPDPRVHSRGADDLKEVLSPIARNRCSVRPTGIFLKAVDDVSFSELKPGTTYGRSWASRAAARRRWAERFSSFASLLRAVKIYLRGRGHQPTSRRQRNAQVPRPSMQLIFPGPVLVASRPVCPWANIISARRLPKCISWFPKTQVHEYVLGVDEEMRSCSLAVLRPLSARVFGRSAPAYLYRDARLP